MKHILLPRHLAHCRKLGISIPQIMLDIPEQEYKEHYENWRRTLPHAGHEEWHKRALAHAAWRRHANRTEEKHASKLQQRTIVAVLILIAIVLLTLLFSGKAHAQFSHISTIQVLDNNNSQVAFFAAPFTVKCLANLTCTLSGSTLSINAASGGTGCTLQGGVGLLLYDTGTACNDITKWSSNGTTTITGIATAIFDLSAAATFKLPTSAGAAPTGDGIAAFNSTSHLPVWGFNGASTATLATTLAAASHQFLTSYTQTTGAFTQAQPVAADIGSIPGSNGQLLFNNAGAIGAEDPVISYSTPAESTAAWTSATGGNTAVSVNLYTSASSSSYSSVVVTLNQGSTITGGVVTFEVSDTTAFTNAYNAYCWQMTGGTLASSYTLTATTNVAFVCPVPSFQAFRVRLSTVISGTGTVNVGVQPSAAPAQSLVTVQGTVTTTPPANASTNVAQFGGTNVSTGTGAGGAGIPRVTISNDSSLAANQSVNVNQVAGAASSATNPLYTSVTDGTNAMGAMANYGTAPGAVKALNANVAVTNTPNVNIQANASVNLAQVGATTTVTDGTAGVQAVGGHFADNGAAATTNRVPMLEGIARTDYSGGTAKTAGRDAAPDVGTDGLLHSTILSDMSIKRYRASSKFAASSTTDNWRISGNASNTVVIEKLIVSCTQTTAGILNLEVKKESAAETGGTAGTPTVVPIDSNKAAGSSVVNSYTGTGPTVGTLVGDLDNYQLGCLAAGTASPNDIYITTNPVGTPFAVLRGTAEGVALNFGGAITGGNLTVTVQWEEVTTITP